MDTVTCTWLVRLMSRCCLDVAKVKKRKMCLIDEMRSETGLNGIFTLGLSQLFATATTASENTRYFKSF
jgi:hypothetical protein